MPEEKKANIHLDADREIHQKEWEKTRDSLQFFDDKLHDLRKYGFSFVTALSAAGSILAPIVISDASTSVLGHVKLAVFIVTLMLICALYLFDKNYRVMQQAVATRSLILEKLLNLELSETITIRYWMDKIRTNVVYLYVFFILGVAVLGGVVLYPDWYLIWWLGGAVVVSWGFVYFQDKQDLKFPHGMLDWTISPLECADNEYIKITVNNLCNDGKLIVIPTGTNIWVIKSADGTEIHREPVIKEIQFYDNYTRIYKPGEKLSDLNKPVVCELWPLYPEGLWDRPLNRKIIFIEPIKQDTQS